MFEIINQIEFVWNRRKSKYGLLLLILFAWVLIYFISNRAEVQFVTELVFYISSVPLVVVFWMYSSGRWIKKSNRITIAYALRASNPKSQTIVNSTINSLLSLLDRVGVLNLFKFIEIGSDAINTLEDAQKFVNRHKINLLIHGDIDCGHIDSIYTFNLSNFFFTYYINNAQLNLDSRTALTTDLNLFTSNRNWIIDETNDLKQISQVANNLMEIILSTIAFGLAFNMSHIKTSIQLIETLLPLLDAQITAGDKTITIDKEKHELYMPIEVLRSGRLKIILANVYVANSHVLIAEAKYVKALESAEKGIQLGVNPIIAITAKAYCYYLSGSIEESSKEVDKLGELDSENPVYLVDKAFFEILNRNYSIALELYERLPENTLDTHASMPSQVTDFLKQRLLEKPHEAAFHFGIGYLNVRFGNDKIGRKHLSSFLIKTKTKTDFSELRKVAGDLLDEPV